MRERNIIIHWGPVETADVGNYIGQWLTFVKTINALFANSINPTVVDSSNLSENNFGFDTIALRRVPPECVTQLVQRGDVVTLYGCKKSVCVRMAREALVRKLGFSHVRINEDGVID